MACKQLENPSLLTYVLLKQSFGEMQAFSNSMVKQSFSYVSLFHLQILMNVQDLILAGKAFV